MKPRGTKPVTSMTGFARGDGQHGRLAWVWEVKSVNSKGLDLRPRLPSGFDVLEGAVREGGARRFKRGNITVSLTYSRSAAAEEPGLRVNRVLLDELLALAGGLAAEGKAETPRLDALLTVRGVIEPVEEPPETDDDRAAREAEMLDSLEAALDALVEMRAAEGRALAEVLWAQLDRIAELIAAAGETAEMQPDAIRARLKQQVEALLEAVPALPEDRLASEAALIAAKADVREELDRLVAHVAAARDLLGGGGPVGRRLDFLCQEFNREANTLCAKSSDIELTTVGLELKAAIEQFREQVQNLE